MFTILLYSTQIWKYLVHLEEIWINSYEIPGDILTVSFVETARLSLSKKCPYSELFW